MGGSKAKTSQTTVTATEDARLVYGGTMASDWGRVITFSGGGYGKGTPGGQAVTDQGIGIQAGGDIVTGDKLTLKAFGDSVINYTDTGGEEVARVASAALGSIGEVLGANQNALETILTHATEVTATEEEQKQKSLFYAALGVMALGGLYLATRGK